MPSEHCSRASRDLRYNGAVFDSLSMPGMIPALLIVLAIHICSLAVLWAVLVMFGRVRLGQRRFFCSVYGLSHERAHDIDPPIEDLRRHWREYPVLSWVYIISTIVITVTTTLIFFFQPHVL